MCRIREVMLHWYAASSLCFATVNQLDLLGWFYFIWLKKKNRYPEENSAVLTENISSFANCGVKMQENDFSAKFVNHAESRKFGRNTDRGKEKRNHSCAALFPPYCKHRECLFLIMYYFHFRDEIVFLCSCAWPRDAFDDLSGKMKFSVVSLHFGTVCNKCLVSTGDGVGLFILHGRNN